MKPGRELDALIAEKVMGQKLHQSAFHGFLWFGEDGFPVKPYSTDIAASWEVVEKIKTIGPFSPDGIILRHDPYGEPEWIVGVHEWDEIKTIAASTISMSHAICLAALKAIGVEV
jgi:hypothetical protein